MNDEAEIDRRWPALAKVGDTITIPSASGQLEAVTVVRRELSVRDGVLFTLRFTDGRMRTWEWFD